MSFIQGPPGTGKTETILNLACCAARLGEGRSVAIVSSNNSALDNVRTKIGKFDGALPNQRWLQQHFARLGSAAKRKEFQDLRLEEPVFRFSGCSVKIPTDCGLMSVSRERSFLDVCLDVFGDRTARITLRCHYRCHPGIIGFCAREVYQEEKLEICTPHWNRSVRTPIKVLWFEGDYCERCALSGKENEKIRYSKRNRKQVRCFMEEEWGQLWERLQGPETPSVCILSPFKGQLAALRDAIRQELAVQGRDEGEVELALEDETDAGQGETIREPPMLTIHKSQGQEFDIVYLLPVEDGDWEWPWSQQKRLINVAVSRARRELRLILSSALMDEEMQRELTGRPVLPGDTAQDPEKAEDQRTSRSWCGTSARKTRLWSGKPALQAIPPVHMLTASTAQRGRLALTGSHGSKRSFRKGPEMRRKNGSCRGNMVSGGLRGGRAGKAHAEIPGGAGRPPVAL